MASFPSMPSIERTNEKNISVSHGNAYHAYLYFPYTKNPGTYPLDHTCRYLCQRLQV